MSSWPKVEIAQSQLYLYPRRSVPIASFSAPCRPCGTSRRRHLANRNSTSRIVWRRTAEKNWWEQKNFQDTIIHVHTIPSSHSPRLVLTSCSPPQKAMMFLFQPSSHSPQLFSLHISYWLFLHYSLIIWKRYLFIEIHVLNHSESITIMAMFKSGFLLFQMK